MGVFVRGERREKSESERESESCDSLFVSLRLQRQLLRYCTKVFNKICSDEVVAAMPREFKYVLVSVCLIRCYRLPIIASVCIF